MRKLLYLGFCLVLAMGIGCAITDYALITDNDQARNTNEANYVVNTNGKAHIREDLSFPQYVWVFGDQHTEGWLTFVDQQADGDRALTNYVNIGAFPFTGGPGTSGAGHDDRYCNPDWTGCSIWTSADPAGPFDGTTNLACSPGGAGFGILTTAARTPAGECGRIGIGTDLSSRLQFLNMGELGEFDGAEGLFYNFNHNNTTLLLNGQMVRTVPSSAFISPGEGLGVLDMSNPLWRHAINDASRVVGRGQIFDLTLIYNGVTLYEKNGQMKLIGDLPAWGNKHF
jgi:hypothetical protein